MERGKRASMREGPLAALFRKTEDAGHGDVPGADREGGPRPADRGHQRSEFGQVPEPQEPAEPRVGKPHPSGDDQTSFDDRDPRLEELRPAPPSARATHEPEPPRPEPREERRARTP